MACSLPLPQQVNTKIYRAEECWQPCHLLPLWGQIVNIFPSLSITQILSADTWDWTFCCIFPICCMIVLPQFCCITGKYKTYICNSCSKNAVCQRCISGCNPSGKTHQCINGQSKMWPILLVGDGESFRNPSPLWGLFFGVECHCLCIRAFSFYSSDPQASGHFLVQVSFCSFYCNLL